MPLKQKDIIVVGIVSIIVICGVTLWWTMPVSINDTGNKSSQPFQPQESKLPAPPPSAPITDTPAKHLSDMSPQERLQWVSGRQKRYDWLVTQSPSYIYRYWQDLFNKGTYEKDIHLDLSQAQSALANRLRAEKDGSVYQDIKHTLTSDHSSRDEKAWMIGMLAKTATAEAMEILVEEAMETPKDDFVRARLHKAIGDVAKNHWEGRIHTELSPPLEQAWKQKGTEDEHLLSALAEGIAYLGTKDGVKLLLEGIERSEWSGSNLDEIYESLNTRAQIAFAVIDRDIGGLVENPEAIAALAEGLSNRTVNDPVFIASASALSAIAALESTKNLFKWAKDAPPEAAGVIREGEWFSSMDEESESFVREALPRTVFHSQEVRREIENSLELY